MSRLRDLILFALANPSPADGDLIRDNRMEPTLHRAKKRATDLLFEYLSVSEDGIHRGVGTHDEGSSVEYEPEPERKPSRDLRITEGLQIGKGSLHQKAQDNITALRTLKAVESEGLGRNRSNPEVVLPILDDAMERYLRNDVELGEALHAACSDASAVLPRWQAWALALEGGWK